MFPVRLPVYQAFRRDARQSFEFLEVSGEQISLSLLESFVRGKAYSHLFCNFFLREAEAFPGGKDFVFQIIVFHNSGGKDRIRESAVVIGKRKMHFVPPELPLSGGSIIDTNPSNLQKNDMCRIENVYSAFCHAVCGRIRPGGDKITFDGFCAQEGISQTSFDEFLFNELGFSGEEILDIAFKNY